MRNLEVVDGMSVGPQMRDAHRGDNSWAGYEAAFEYRGQRGYDQSADGGEPYHGYQRERHSLLVLDEHKDYWPSVED